MKYSVKSINLALQPSGCLIVYVFKNKQLSHSAQQLNALSRGYIIQVLEKGDLKEKLGQSLLLYSLPGIAAERVLLIYSEGASLSYGDFRKVITGVAIALKSITVKNVISCLTDLNIVGYDFRHLIRHTVELLEDSFYRFDQFKTDQTLLAQPEEFIFNLSVDEDVISLSMALKQALAIAAGIKLSKDLANLPSNQATPKIIAEKARLLAKENNRFMVNILEESDIKKEGMGGLLAVSQGSEEPAQFVTLQYQGAKDKEQKPVVLVGKGVTFDSGGICLKPAPLMDEMKFDMAGAASVMGVLKAVSDLSLPINVIGIMPLTENLPSGTAIKPGDVVTTLSGLTVEVINTDAEGRLILADALSYSARFSPECVIDIATLTGAIIITLGSVATGLMSNNKDLIFEIEQAAQKSYDRVWALPLWEDYQSQINSNIADIANIGINGGKSITAACFLSRFTKNLKWAHLDIAGTAWKSGTDKKATGRPVSLLAQFLLNRC